MKVGTIAKQNGYNLKKAGDSSLIYQSSAPVKAALIAYNTLETPRGKQYSVILPDGTKAWLNSASTLTYPTAFKGKNRSVTMTGEVYFQVVHNNAAPFRVEVGGQTIEDIGTEFNVNAYKDEPYSRTTLIGGSVKVVWNNQQKVLKPGQAAISSTGQMLEVKDANTEAAIAWKNGYFLFDKESLGSIMREVSRWYDVDVDFGDNQLKSEIFWGSVTRYENISAVLKMLEVTGNVHFKIDGRKITVLTK